jgi:predicted nuclease with TOPRIM domain
MLMDWPTVSLVIGLVIALFTFIWGILKVFKKPVADKAYEEPLKNVKEKLEEKISELKDELNSQGNRIHDLETYKDILSKGIDDLKGEVSKVSGKCDAILDKVIEYISKD